MPSNPINPKSKPHQTELSTEPARLTLKEAKSSSHRIVAHGGFSISPSKWEFSVDVFFQWQFSPRSTGFQILQSPENNHSKTRAKPYSHLLRHLYLVLCPRQFAMGLLGVEREPLACLRLGFWVVLGLSTVRLGSPKDVENSYLPHRT